MEIALHYYQFNIGDYRRDTAHLSLLEHGIYRQLIDTYYLSEKPLCTDIATLMRTHCIRTADEEQSLKNVLHDFFELLEDGWHHRGCERVIDQYRAKSDKAKASAMARWGQSDANALQTHSKRNANGMLTNNHKPITNNQEPIKNNTRLKALSRPPDVQESVWDDFCQHRKAQRAAITQTAIDGIEREAKKAGWTLEAALSECVLRGWRGFKADWVKSGMKSNLNRQEALEARNKAIGDAWLAKETSNEAR